MKKWTVLLLVLLLPFSAQAEVTLSLSSDTIAVESILDFSVSGAEHYRYTLYLDNKKLFESEETTLPFGSYLPQKEGSYVLQADGWINGKKMQAEHAFTVTPPLTASLSSPARDYQTGEGIRLAAAAEGGSGVYRYLYCVTCNGQEVLRQEGAEQLLFVPETAGNYRASLTVTDGLDTFANAEHTFTVRQGSGISFEAAGGALLANGGETAYLVRTSGPWTATADSPLFLLSDHGESGDLLVLALEEETDIYRSLHVTVQSGGKEAVLTVGQSAGYHMEEESYLVPPAFPLLIDGSVHAQWLDAEGERMFSVQSETPWRVESCPDGIAFSQTEDSITLSVSPFLGRGVQTQTLVLDNGETAAALHIYQFSIGQEETPFVAPGPFPLPEDNGLPLYSQCSGYWKDKKYKHSNLEVSGCAIFALSHALWLLGYDSPEIRPENLAVTYASALYKDEGTINANLVGKAADDLGFKTRYELYKDLPTIRSKMDQGALFSFSIVSGHIAMIAEKSADGKMFRVIDSAPSATFERIKNASIYVQSEDGRFIPVASPEEIPGIRYFIETSSFGGATYWLEGSYIAKRGVRLIQPQ